MKRKLLYSALILICISFFSFARERKCDPSLCYKKCSKKDVKTNADKAWDISPFYNFLII